ncbi:MAG TPA: S8 family serine peptidase [archaeon]|nr:S8 family serine peptidase [archaeon]
MKGAFKVTIFIFIISILLSGIIAAKSPDSAEIPINKELSNRNAILLKNAQFDTSIPQPAVVSADISSISQYPDNVDGYYIVQFSGSIREEWKQDVRDTGAVIYDYIPNNAFVVRMSTTVKSQVESLDKVQWIGIYQPSYRVSPVLSSAISPPVDDNVVTQEGSEGVQAVHEDIIILLFDANDNERVLSGIENLGGDIMDNAGDIIRVRVDRAKIGDIAIINGVSWIEKYVQPVILNDVAANITNVYDVRNTHGLTGSGQTVAVADTGLDTGIDNHEVDGDIHLDFDNRVTFFNYDGSSPDDLNGHGTHTTGSVAGNGSKSSGQYKGMAPEANIISQGLGDDAGSKTIDFSSLTQIFQDAYNNDARIHSNSWGSDVGGDYTSLSQETDQFAWDNKDFVIVFAAGNVANFGINSPGTAKNAITVGASENYRPSFGTSADNISEIASFSSIGPTDDNRIKPDVVAPGTYIASTKSSLTAGTGDYVYMNGTSMATPLTAGTVALIRQYYVDNEFISPSSALLKATLINGAANLSLPSSAQGWGRVDIERSLFPASPRTMRYHDNISLNLSESWNVSYYINDTSEALKITLVWTDVPAAASADPALVNNLDLTVTGPGGTYYGNGALDSVNNVEQVELSSPPVGLYGIKVNGTNIPEGPQPFALMISGALDFTLLVITSATANPATIEANGSDNTTFNVTTTGSGEIASVTLNLSAIGGSTAQAMANNSGIWQYTTNTTTLGTFYLPVNVTDNVGSSNTSVNITLSTIDTTLPTSTSPSDIEFSANATASFDQWVLTDLHPGYYWILRKGTEIISPTIWTNNTNITVSIDTNISLGDFNYTIQYNDSVGNNGTQNVVIITINDTLPPYASGDSPANNSSISDNLLQISVNIMDNASGINPASIVMRVNGIIVTPKITPIAGGYNISNLTVTPFLFTQVVTITINATDNNSNILKHSWSFTFDANPPNVTNPNATPSTIESNGIDTTNLSVIVIDDLDDIANVTINLTQIGGSATAEMTNSSYTYWIISNATGAGNVTYDLPVNATDTAGNSNTSVNITLCVNDTTLPIFSGKIPLTGTTNLTPTISINATDRGAGINASSAEMTVDGIHVQLANISSGFTFNFSNTTSTYNHSDTVNVTFNVSDNEGHKANTSWFFYIDNLAPTVTITSPSDGDSTTASSITVSGSVNGTGSPPTITVNDVIAVNTTNSTTFNSTFSATASLLVDSNAIYANVTDAAGNTDSALINITRNTISSPSSGGGGGGGSSGEERNNILYEKSERINIFLGDHVSYLFEGIPIINVNFTSKVSAGWIKSTIEVLKNTSTLVKTPSPQNVYQNVNIWVGLYGWANEQSIANASISFKVPMEWIKSNNIDEGSIRLYRYHNSTWNPLPTTRVNQDEINIYYNCPTPGFSPFAITGKSKPPLPVKQIPLPAPAIIENNSAASNNQVLEIESQNHEGNIILWVLVIIMLLSIVAAGNYFIEKMKRG